MPLSARTPTAASPVSNTYCRTPPASITMAEEYPASSSSDFQITFPLLLSIATMEAPPPPGFTTNRRPSTSGDSLMPQLMLRALNLRKRFVAQSLLPVAASRAIRLPFEPRA